MGIKSIGLVLIFISIPLLGNLSCTSPMDEVMEFYNKNKDNKDLLALRHVAIKPFRQDHHVKLWDYGGMVFVVTEYDQNANPKLTLRNPEGNLKILEEEYHLTNEVAMEYLCKLYSIFEELDVLAVYGEGDLLSFVVTPNDEVVFVPDKNLRCEAENQILNDIVKGEILIVLDENWFAYRFEKPYSFGGG